ncbi:MAG: hypothetical protein H6Q14_836 [Bacteroidetes bacterium]|nr:hypothetical protein [Bacteroidota bacterium]
MRKNNLKYYIYALFAISIFLDVVSCSDRDVSTLEKATQYSTTAEVFIDGFSQNEDFNAWGDVYNLNIDYSTFYEGTAAIRIDVPNSTDVAGTWAGGNIYTQIPRDLSGYDCLTFYAKSSVAATMIAGFGINSSGSDYSVADSVSLNTTWTKFIIPIPVASKLTAETGMFYYSASPVNTLGYSIWIDDVKFEKLGTLAYPTIQNTLGSSLFLGKTAIGDISLTVSLPTGATQKITASSSYFSFTSSDTAVATVNNDSINVIAAGTSYIMADGFDGNLIVNSNGIGSAPNPTASSNDVLSVFSDSYSNATIYDFWCGTTSISKIYVGSNAMFYFISLNWTCMVLFNSSTSAGYVDASGYKYLHADIMTPNTVTTSSALEFDLGNYSTGSNVSTPIYTYTFSSTSKLKWIQLDIPISSYTRSKLGYITFVGTNLTNLYVDNVYFHN